MTPLPPLVVLTDGDAAEGAGHSLTGVLTAVVDAGVRAVVVRERHLADDERAELVAATRQLMEPCGGVVVVASPVVGGGTAAVHLRSTDPLPSPRPPLVGRSCHDATSVAAAADEGCDWVTLSPVFATPSKPGYGPALGTGELAAITASAAVPVWALGGITPEVAPACITAGATGVAVMGAVMAAGDPAAVAHGFLEALEGSGP